MSRSLLEYFEARPVNLYRVLDLEKIASDLKALRESFKLSQRDFAKKIGVNYGVVQRVEGKKNKRGIAIGDMSLVLEKTGSSMARYFAQEAMAGGTLSHREGSRAGSHVHSNNQKP